MWAFVPKFRQMWPKKVGRWPKTKSKVGRRFSGYCDENTSFRSKTGLFEVFSRPQIPFCDQLGQKPTFFFINFSEKKRDIYRRFGFCPKKVGKWANPQTWSLPTH
ncbi:hypothetical protein SEA_LILHUDDY_88 [Arthrobacter phage LilHuddy]|nr:hypothetical protein SEA_LILHUDDY_88 [Arthrobacter phage LilHuddy]